MDDKDIRRYAKLMQELGLTGLEVDGNGNVVRIERAPAYSVRRNIDFGREIPAPEEHELLSENAFTEAEGEVTITSPFVGICYLAPAENAEPFVKPGSYVKKGDTLCIIESMKLMNEILSEHDGVITEVCAENGQVVDFGTPIFRLKEDSNE